jgi:hypothetical protein
MTTHEYIRIQLDMGDLDELNRLASVGFRVVGIVVEFDGNYALLERPLPPKK